MSRGTPREAATCRVPVKHVTNAHREQIAYSPKDWMAGRFQTAHDGRNKACEISTATATLS